MRQIGQGDFSEGARLLLSVIGKGRFPGSGDPALNALFHGLPNTYADWQKNNFVPRLGVAYEINEKTVVRAGFGGFKNRPAVSDSTFLGGNFPFQGYVGVTNGIVDNPGSASGGIPRPDGGSSANRHGRTSPVQTHAPHLLGRPVTADAVFLKQRLNVASKVNRTGRLGGQESDEQGSCANHETGK